MSSSEENEIKRLLKKLPFYNVPIEKVKTKKLSNVDMLRELPFYDELIIVKTAIAFKKYAKSHSMEIIKEKDENVNDPLVQLEASKPVAKNLFRDLLNEIKGFKYQITLKVLLSKQKQNGGTELSTVYFNSTEKTVINTNKYGLNKIFQQILYRIGNWINEGSAWSIEHIGRVCQYFYS